MVQTMSDPEVGVRPGTPVIDHHDHLMTTLNQPFQVKPNFWDSSGPLFSIYCNAAKDEDSKMVEGWQKDAEGIIIFTGLFSAAVAVLLAVTVQDLRPSSQDTSAFYLGNIYQVLADPNATRSSTLSPVVKPPSFTPPRYAVWVNSLWFLSLVMGLSCALWATSLQQWARRYLRLAQPPRCSPERQARMRAVFAEGVDKMHIPWAVEGLPTLLHVSLFLFFGGLAIFLFNVDREVFRCVISWIGLFSAVYGFITLLPIIQHHGPYNSPLSAPAWFLYASIIHVNFKILAFITYRRFWSQRTWERCKHLRDRYRRWMLGGVEKAAEEMASERSSKINIQILDWTISALGDDDSLKSFFEAIPGFFNSKLVNHLERDFPVELLQKFEDAVDGFLGRTWSSNSVGKSEKLHRLDVSMNAMDQFGVFHVWFILHNIFYENWGEVPQSVEMGHTLARWCTSSNKSVARCARAIIARILVNVRERNDSWVKLAAQVFGLPERDLRDNIALGDDSVILAIFICVTRQYLDSDYFYDTVLEELSKLDIHNTHPRLQHNFCTFWNEIVQEAKNRGRCSTPVRILYEIRHPYITLHQGTEAALTTFSATTNPYDDILDEPSSYPFCNIASHRLDSTPHDSTLHDSDPPPPPPGSLPEALSPSPTDASTAPQAKHTNIVAGLSLPSDPTITSEIGQSSQSPNTTPLTNPACTSLCPTDGSPTGGVAGEAATTQAIASSAMLPHLREGNEQQDSDIAAPSSETGTSQILSTASKHATLARIPTSLPNTASESYDEGVTFVSNSSHFTLPLISSSIPPSRLTSSTTFPRLRPRGLVNPENMCFASAVFQLLVYSPPFWTLYRELGDLKRQREAGIPETDGGATPLVDATVRFFKEFMDDEDSPSTQQQSQPATGGTSRVDEDKKGDNVDSFEPTYMYDAMKKKRQFNTLLDGQQQDAEEFLCLYLDALDEELLGLLDPIGGPQSTSAALEVEERKVSHSGQTDVGSQIGQGFMGNLVELPTTRIFGGRFRSLIRSPNQPDRVPTEDWKSLHLNIQPDSIRTVQDTLTYMSHPRSMQVSTTGLDNASQQVLIEALPPVLVLHLNRVQYDAAAGGIMKIGKSIQLEPELEIPLDIIIVPDAQRLSEPPHYKLHGVLYHHGESADGGHYTVDVLHQNSDGDTGEVWLHIDDEVVNPMRHENVFEGHGAERAADERCVYLLFYCRTSQIGTS